MKKFLRSFVGIVLSAVMLLAVLPAARVEAASVTASGKCGTNLNWVFYSDGTLKISGTGAMQDYPNCAAAPWANYKEDILNVEMEEGITHIGSCAFYLECQNLESVSIPDTVTSIGEYAFGCCAKLTDITIPDSVTEIGEHAFAWVAFEELTIPSSVTSIGNSAFDACAYLKKVNFRANISEIPDKLFSGCGRLEVVLIPDGVTTIGEGAFNECWNLYAVSVPDSVTSIEKYAFKGCFSLRYACYEGTKAQWENVSVDDPDSSLEEAFRFMKYETVYKPITEIYFRNPEITLSVGEEKSLGLVVNPGDHTESVTWGYKSGSDTTCFKLNQKGDATTIKGLKPGTVTVYANVRGGRLEVVVNIIENVSDEPEEPNDPVITDRNPDYIEGYNLRWNVVDGKYYWFENGYKQGTYNDAHGVVGDGTIRGREICDPATNAWYWLDSVYGGAKAINKEVWMPYIYQDEANWSDADIESIAAESDGGMAGMGRCVLEAIRNHSGKWVAYDNEGRMLKGWIAVAGEYEEIYREDQYGNVYYYDNRTGLMAKGWVTLDGTTYHFDEVTGVLIK